MIKTNKQAHALNELICKTFIILKSRRRGQKKIIMNANPAHKKFQDF